MRFVAGGVSDTPIRSQKAEKYLLGRQLSKEDLAEAAALAAGECNPEADLHASAEYRKEMVEVLGRKALEDALPELRGGKNND